jgi:hypothetical protein
VFRLDGLTGLFDFEFANSGLAVWIILKGALARSSRRLVPQQLSTAARANQADVLRADASYLSA